MRAFCAIMKAAAAMLLAAVVAVGWYKIGWQAAAIAAAAVSAAYVIFKGAAPEEEETMGEHRVKLTIDQNDLSTVNFNVKGTAELFVYAASAMAAICLSAVDSSKGIYSGMLIAETEKIINGESDFVKTASKKTIDLNKEENHAE